VFFCLGWSAAQDFVSTVKVRRLLGSETEGSQFLNALSHCLSALSKLICRALHSTELGFVGGFRGNNRKCSLGRQLLFRRIELGMLARCFKNQKPSQKTHTHTYTQRMEFAAQAVVHCASQLELFCAC
jgi:hypothetical protein